MERAGAVWVSNSRTSRESFHSDFHQLPPITSLRKIWSHGVPRIQALSRRSRSVIGYDYCKKEYYNVILLLRFMCRVRQFLQTCRLRTPPNSRTTLRWVQSWSAATTTTKRKEKKKRNREIKESYFLLFFTSIKESLSIPHLVTFFKRRAISCCFCLH